jgi:hypothetical protein
MMSHLAGAFLAGLNALLAVFALAGGRLAFLAARPRLTLAVLGVLAAAGLGAHLDFGRFHGDRGAVHYWDFFHYYMGSAYFDELGYTGLYDAAARADLEDEPGAVGERAPVRSLADYRIGSRRDAAERGAEVAARFTTERWARFKAELSVFRAASPGAWRASAVLMDHGYNGTPLVSAVLGTLARQGLVDTGTFVGAMAFADLVLAALAALLIGRWLGAESGIVFLALFALNPFNDFAMIGGSYLRHLHLLLLGVGIAAFRSDRKAASGALLAASGLLRLFPLLLVAGLALHHLLRRDRRVLLRQNARFWIAFAVSCAVLVGATSARYGRRAENPWSEFAAKISVHADKLTPNIVGLTYPFLYSTDRNAAAIEESWRDGRRLNWVEEAEKTLAGRREALVAAGALLALLALIALRRSNREGTGMLAGCAAIFGAFHLSHYDWAVLCLTPLFLPGRRWALPGVALLFAAVASIRLVPALDAVLDLRFLVASALLGLALIAALVAEAVAARRPPSSRATVSDIVAGDR